MDWFFTATPSTLPQTPPSPQPKVFFLTTKNAKLSAFLFPISCTFQSSGSRVNPILTKSGTDRANVQNMDLLYRCPISMETVWVPGHWLVSDSNWRRDIRLAVLMRMCESGDLMIRQLQHETAESAIIYRELLNGNGRDCAVWFRRWRNVRTK